MTKKKKILIIVLSVVAVVAIAVGITVGVLLRPKTAPKPGAGVIYQTKEVKIWSGYSGAYMDFEYIEEPAESEKVEGKRYGYVFNVKFYNNNSWEAWLSGSWEMNEAKTELTLTANWGSGDNDVKLADATSGQAKTYTAANGKFVIGVMVPSDGKVNFTLDPVADKVGEGGTPSEPCTEHVDANGDGKCDNCGEDVPVQQPESPTLLLTMNATDTATTMAAEIKMYQNNTFDFVLPDMGGKVFGGTWASSDTTGQNPVAPLTLTVDSTGSPVVGETITVTITPAQDYSSMTYACHVDYVVPQTITMAFDFTGTFVVQQQPTTPQVQLSLTDTQTSGYVTAYGKLELLNNNTWTISIAYVEGGEYTKTASGTWSMAQDYSKITLTVTEDTADTLANDTYEMTVNASDTNNILYTVNLPMTIPQVGNLDFEFSNAPKIQATLTATNDGKFAKIELLDNNTWKLYMSYYAIEDVPQGYTETASGTAYRDSRTEKAAEKVHRIISFNFRTISTFS